ncbi:chromosome condensation protein CrcB (plasmid) [Cellulomonas sp. WB94]|uniref:fluoride efflux transporter FluC n=1 Tax=Cellulomonas sp. WB94 TaxID=2173174 RepID=UPI000D564F3C|nr:CrcB family protein [Cellulomonas sp. WB94]PVU84289.1 chromosome condensation protein CrcB [Cellulomonas sp. WB94]
MTLLLVALLGGLGAATRFVVDGLIRGRWSQVFPLATVLINVSGSALLGLLAGASAYHSLPTTTYLVAAVGFCGGYTTFSTAMVETVRLAQSGAYRSAVVNALGTLLLAVGAAALGVLVMWLLA